MSNSRIENKLKELNKVIEEEMGEGAKIEINFYDAGNFSDVTRKSNFIASDLDIKHKWLWISRDVGGMEVWKDNYRFSFYFEI